MGTLFETLLIGDDDEQLTAVAEAALDEIVRIELLLSRYDPRSEIARINRAASSCAVLVDRELFEVLETCRDAWQRTGGYFDPAATSTRTQQDTGGRPTFADVELDPAARTVRFADPRLALDLGAFGKGYALDRAAEIVQAFGVRDALLHGGTSSIRALGLAAGGQPWPVGLRDPWSDDHSAEAWQVHLSNQGCSSSAVLVAGQRQSDIIDPHRQRPLVGQAAVVAIAPTAAEAEVLSTALLAMGKERAAAYSKEMPATAQCGWIDRAREQPVLTWFSQSDT